jgi:hypothetical protein
MATNQSQARLIFLLLAPLALLRRFRRRQPYWVKTRARF